jgi:hypothetical protein
MTCYTIIRPIFGLKFHNEKTESMKVNDNIKILSKIGLEKIKKTQSGSALQYSAFESLEKESKLEVFCFMMCEVDAIDIEEAISISYYYSLKLENILRLIQKEPHDRLSVGLLSVRNPIPETVIGLDKDSRPIHRNSNIGKGSPLGGFNMLREERHFSDPTQFKKLCDLIIKEKLTNYENKLSLASEWIGKAINEIEDRNKIIYSFFAIESLLNLTQSEPITTQISENTALILSNNLSKRKEIISKMKKLYKVRSKIVHGEIVNNINDEGKQAVNYAWHILVNLLVRDDLDYIKSEKALKEYLLNIKLSGTEPIQL